MSGHQPQLPAHAIRPGMAVLTAEGQVLGSVTGLDRRYVQCRIAGDPRQHFIPLAAVAWAGEAVRLHRSHREVLTIL